MRTAFLLLFVSFFANGQALRDINYKYLYDGSTPFYLHAKLISSNNRLSALFSFQVKDTTDNVANYTLSWETRADLSEKDGHQLSSDSIIYSTNETGSVEGRVLLGNSQKVLAARIVQKSAKRAWFYYVVVNQSTPEYTYVVSQGKPVLRRYLKTNLELTIDSDSIQTVSFYRDQFPAGTPVFSETIGRVSKGFIADSVFTISPASPFSPGENGLYLVQPDTASEKGLAFRAESDYPRYAKIENLADPLIYICTRQEFDKVKKAKGDKSAFDRVILTITGEKERAKIFMRTYFRRVEMANQFFSSYKEGWKTDRGMIFIIFGAPQEVFKFPEREVWKYDDGVTKVTFDFAKSATIFDPQNFVLIRNEKFKDTWYEAIDLRRNAQF